MLKLPDKDFKAAIIQVFQQAIMDVFQTKGKQKVSAKKYMV